MLAAVVLLLVASFRVNPQPSKLAIAIGSPLLIIVVSSLALFLNFKLIELINGTTVSWPANDFPFRVVLFSTPAVVGFCLASLANMEDIATPAPAIVERPDADLRGLWQEYRQNSTEWDAAADDESERYGNRAHGIERRIIDSPAQGILGIAIKLRVAADNFPEGERPEHNDDRALASVLNDADRLAGFTEPQRVWRAS